jgi:hypothetical protein
VLLALSLFLTEKGGNHMIYNKLEGTTSKSFKLGKNGVIVESLDSGGLKIVTKDYEFILGTDEVEGLLGDNDQRTRTIASWQVVENYIITKLEDVVGDLTGVAEALQQISGIAAAIDNDPNFFNNILRLNDKQGNAVDGQIVKGTTTFEKDITLGGKIIGPSTLTIDPFLADTEDPNNPNLGTVVIHGNLQIDGVTTTINSQTVDIVDKNITLAVGSTNAAAADGAGISIEGAGVSFIYSDSDDSMNLNKNLNVDGELSVTGVITSRGEQVLTSISGATASTGEAITSAEIVDGELIFEKDEFVHLGTSSSSIDQTIYGEKTFKDELKADSGITTTVITATVTTGTAPMIVSSKTVVANLNADQIDGADLETSITIDSDIKIPTSKAVADYSVPKILSVFSTKTYDTATATTEKNNSFLYIMNSDNTSSKISVSELQRPTHFIIQNDEAQLGEIKIGDFIYKEKTT